MASICPICPPHPNSSINYYRSKHAGLGALSLASIPDSQKLAHISSSLLMHYWTGQELLLSCDPSPYGIIAVLSHRIEKGSEQPIAISSRSLKMAGKQYAELDKGLAIIFRATQFLQYLFGCQFTIFSDHKPLIHLPGESRTVPAMASSHVQH